MIHSMSQIKNAEEEKCYLLKTGKMVENAKW